ncbi:MAG: RDD family protein [Calditrichaeota bacterium]|nr:RDD family protein [Calditrichota bacterium]
MQTIKIKTTQNIDLDYDLAGVGDRMIAVLIDIVIQAGYVLTMFVFTGVLQGAGLTIGTVGFIILYLPVFLYEVLTETFFNGQTPGKKARNIRVINLDGTEPSVGNYIIRWIFRFIEITASMGSIALLTLLINGRGQRLGDMAAGTTVVRTKQGMRLEETIISEIDENYTPTFAEAVNLSDQDIEIVKEVLRSQPEDDTHGIIKIGLIKKSASLIQKKLNINSSMDSRRFLKTIIDDYNYLKGRIG